MDVHTPEQRRRNMQAIRSKETRMEVKLGKELWANGLRYRKNDSKVFGRPDFTFKRLKVAIFVDSEFFHGKNWNTEKHRIKTNQEFWWKKITDNMRRDALVNKRLRAEGWKVLRFWSLDVNKKLQKCCSRILKTIEKREDGY